jgi:predicted outer membrane protein
MLSSTAFAQSVGEKTGVNQGWPAVETLWRTFLKLRDVKPEEFASEYDAMQVSAHEDAVSLYERYAKGGDNPKVKDWRGKTLPALRHHLEMAQELDKNWK